MTSDHLDRHGSLEAYRRGQAAPGRARRPGRRAHPQRRRPGRRGLRRARHGAARCRYRRDRPLPGGLGVVDGWIVADGVERLALAGGVAGDRVGGRIMPVAELAIPGAHNVSNALAAIAAGLAASASRPRPSARAAAGFTGVEHRLRDVALIDGVRFVNDSQGTQPDAVIAALRAFDGPIVLIAGGRDKGVDLSAWRRSSPSVPPPPS